MKSKLKSKTLWFNLITVLIGVLGLLNPEILKSMGICDTTKAMHIFTLIMGVGNLVLRTYFTSEPISEYSYNKKNG